MVAKRRENLIREPSWKKMSKMMADLGWFTERMEKKKIVFERGRQRIVALRVERNKWKVEYFSGRIMDDIAGISDSRFAKYEILEMGMFK